MNADLEGLLDKGNGVLTRADALAVVKHHVLDHAIAKHELVRLFPRVYAAPEDAADAAVVSPAALAYAGPDAALSHLSALHVGELPAPEGGPIHLTVPASVRLRCQQGVLVHRRKGFRAEAPDVVIRDALPVVRLERGIVESWPYLINDEQRAPAILAVQRRLTIPDRLYAALGALPSLRGRAELRHLIELLRQGCHSELEIWGHEEVFTHPSLPPSRAQVPVQLRGRTVYLDRFFDREMVAAELDGRKWHSSPEQREADMRRDAALAALGILVVRFSHDRLVGEADEIRRETLAILETRRRQLGVA